MNFYSGERTPLACLVSASRRNELFACCVQIFARVLVFKPKVIKVRKPETGSPARGTRALPFRRAFFLGADRRELDRAFLP
jgi:hypothetical protein